MTVIQGITLEIKDRLNEEGVDGIQALAMADVPKLRPGEVGSVFVDEAEFASLGGLGIRTYSGLLAYRNQAGANPVSGNTPYNELSESLLRNRYLT
ncbi:hypothetical protein [Nitrospira sp. Nam74]